MPATPDAFEGGAVLRVMGARLVDLKDFLDQAGSILTSRAQDAFQEQKRGSALWKARGVPNVAGIVADLVAGRGVPARRFEPRPAGVDTGALRGSISYRVVDHRTVEVGSTLPYAGRVQHGGKSTIPLPTAFRKSLYKFLKSSKGKPWRKNLGFLFGLQKAGRPLVTNVPARPFVAVTAEDHADLSELLRDYVADRQRREGRRVG